MKNLIINLVFLFIAVDIVKCQNNFTNKWCFGDGAGLDFSSPTPSFFYSNVGGTSGYATQCDENGNLLFYGSDTPLNALGFAIPSNNPGISSLGTNRLSFKQPGSSNLYYLFACALGGLSYAKIDMSLAAGLGSLVVTNSVVNTVLNNYHLAATKHCNNFDYWVISSELSPRKLYSYLVTSTGVSTTPITSTFSIPGFCSFGTTKFSPSGKLFAAGSDAGTIVLLDFNKATGVFSNPRVIGSLFHPMIGIEFSPDETKLYATQHILNSQYLYQYNLCAGTSSAITASQFSITNTGAIKRGLQLAKNGKIYVCRWDQNAVGVINNPNIQGAGCNFVEAGQSLGLATSKHFFPSFVSSDLYSKVPLSLPSFTLNSLGKCRNVQFAVPTIAGIGCSTTNIIPNSTQWNFGDTASGVNNLSNAINPSHEFTSSGIFTVRLIIDYECTIDTLTFQVNVQGPSIIPTATAATCGGLGSAFANVFGGIGALNYTWMPGNISTANATNLTPNNYTVSLFDSGGQCTTESTISVAANFTLSSVISATNLLCGGIPTGKAEILPNGGTGNYSYSWMPGNYTTSLIGGLLAGTYTVTINDLQSPVPCAHTRTLQISQPPPLTSNIISSSFSTCVGNTISLQGGFAGGSGSKSLTWNNTFTTSTHIVSQTISGTYSYSFLVTDSLGCTSSSSVVLYYSNVPFVSVNTATICLGETATLTAYGASNYTWIPSNIVGGSAILNPTVTTQYSVYSYSTGCTSETPILTTVFVVPPPSLTVSLSSPSLCFQAFNGSPNTITLTSQGANSYTLFTAYLTGNGSPIGPSSTVSAKPPYSITSALGTATIVGSNGVCSRSTSINFSIIPNPTVIITPTLSICAGENYTYTSFGANSYVWTASTPNYTAYHDGGVAVAHPSINSVFSVYGSSLGCNSASKTSTITVFPLPEINFSPQAPIICLYEKTTLTANGTGTSFEWFPAEGLNNTVGMTVIASPLQTKNYTVVASANNCTYAANISVTVLALPQPTITNSKSKLCVDEMVNLKGAGGVRFDWNGPQNIFYQGQEINFKAASSQYSGDYTLTVLDENGCKGNTVTPIFIQALPQGHLEGIKENVCVPYCGDFNFAETLSNSELTSTWQIGGQIISNNRFSHCLSEAGTYTIAGRIFDAKTTCSNSVSYQIKVNSKPQADFYFSPQKPVEGIDEVIFTNASIGEEQIKWNWFFNDEARSKFESQNIAYKFDNSGLYTIAMVVTNKSNCSDTAVRTIQVEGDFGMYIPNAFTPNNDGLNDEFKPVIRSAQKYNLKIFDRWGHLIFESNEVENGWDGTNRGGVNSKVGVYAWRIEVTTHQGETKSIAGHVTLVQ